MAHHRQTIAERRYDYIFIYRKVFTSLMALWFFMHTVFEVKKRWRGIRDYRRIKRANGTLDAATTEPQPQIQQQQQQRSHMIKSEDDAAIVSVDDNSSMTSNRSFQFSDDGTSQHGDNVSVSQDDLDGAQHLSALATLFDFFGRSVAALPSDLQRRCRLDIMEIINRYEEVATFRASDESTG